MSKKRSYLKKYQYSKSSDREESCTEGLMVKITPSMMEILKEMGSNKAEFVRQAIEEKLSKYPHTESKGLRIAEEKGEYNV